MTTCNAAMDNDKTTRFLSREESREVDRRAIQDFGMTGLVLMENAGRGCVEYLNRRQLNGPLIVFCGKGNNGGDGFVIARHLALRDVPVEIILCCQPSEFSGDALANFRIASRAELPLRLYHETDPLKLAEKLAAAEWCVDALLGTGASGEPRPPISDAIDAMNSAAERILSVDIPSGLDCDTGIPARQTVSATATCTFVARKIGFRAEQAIPYLGDVHVVDIGVPKKLLREMNLCGE